MTRLAAVCIILGAATYAPSGSEEAAQGQEVVNYEGARVFPAPGQTSFPKGGCYLSSSAFPDGDNMELREIYYLNPVTGEVVQNLDKRPGKWVMREGLPAFRCVPHRSIPGTYLLAAGEAFRGEGPLDGRPSLALGFSEDLQNAEQYENLVLPNPDEKDHLHNIYGYILKQCIDPETDRLVLKVEYLQLLDSGPLNGNYISFKLRFPSKEGYPKTFVIVLHYRFCMSDRADIERIQGDLWADFDSIIADFLQVISSFSSDSKFEEGRTGHAGKEYILSGAVASELFQFSDSEDEGGSLWFKAGLTLAELVQWTMRCLGSTHDMPKLQDHITTSDLATVPTSSEGDAAKLLETLD